MEKLDRLGWADGISFESHGARIGVRVTNASVLARLRTLLPPNSQVVEDEVVGALYSLVVGGAGPRPGVKRHHVLFDATTRLHRTLDLDEALHALESQLHFGVAMLARERLFVHAGVVGWKGQTIVIPGRSHAGKSTLVAALVRAGATYYSDEYAVLDREGSVHPYAKSLSLRTAPGLPGVKTPVETLGGTAGDEPLPVGLIVSTEYKPRSHWRPRSISPGQTLLSLLDNTVLARIRPAFALDLLRRAVVGAEGVKGVRGEADATAEAILRRAESVAARRAAAASTRSNAGNDSRLITAH